MHVFVPVKIFLWVKEKRPGSYRSALAFMNDSLHLPDLCVKGMWEYN